MKRFTHHAFHAIQALAGLVLLSGLLYLACNKDDSTTIVNSGLIVEDFDPDMLNAFPIMGYMRTGSPLYPTIDGGGREVVWTLTEPFEVQTTSPNGGFAPVVTMKALYDNYYLYILASWQDTSKSADKDVWFYGSPNSGDTTYYEVDTYSWVKITEPYTGQLATFSRIKVDSTVAPPDTQYVYNYKDLKFSGGEDGLAFMWNINATNFLNLADTWPGEDIALDAGERADIWHWGATRTNPKKHVDDRYVTEDGLGYDTGIGVFRINEDDGAPAFSEKSDPGANVLVLVDSVATPFYAVIPWPGGSRIAGYVMREPDRSRADIYAVGVFDDGTWTLEIKRALETLDDEGHDIRFNPDSDAILEFYIAVYDNGHGLDNASSSDLLLLRFLQFNE